MILIIDNKSKHTNKIRKYCKDNKVQYVSISTLDRLHRVLHLPIKGVIMSGGPLLYDQKICFHKVSLNFAAMLNFNVPVLGICFGHQSIIEGFGGRVKRMRKRIIGCDHITLQKRSKLFAGLPKKFDMYQAHLDTAYILPPHFELLATSANCKTEAVQHRSKPIYGVQFHPESSGELGKKILDNFLKICKIR